MIPSTVFTDGEKLFCSSLYTMRESFPSDRFSESIGHFLQISERHSAPSPSQKKTAHTDTGKPPLRKSPY